MLYLSSLIVSLCSFFFTKRINIELKKNDGNYFSSARTDHFIFDNQTVSLSAHQWYLIKLKLLIKEKKNTVSKFSFDYGDGFSDQHTLELSVKSGIDKGSILLTKQQPLRIKFEPLDAEDEFEVSTLQFIPINQFFAEKYMMNELLHKQNGISGKELSTKVAENANTLKISFIKSLLLEYRKSDNV